MYICIEAKQRWLHPAENLARRTRLFSHRSALRRMRRRFDRRNTDMMTSIPILLRSVVVSTIIAFASMFGIATSVSAAAPQVRTQAPGFYRMMLGDFEITALLDGTHPFPDVEVLTKARRGAEAERSKLFDAHPGEAKALLAASDLTVPTEGSINAFLINTGTKLILIDSGAGTLYGACCGHLMDNLRAAGYQPEQVDEVFLTHLHADHVGGIAPGGKPAFPNAIIRASKLDADYWLDDAIEKTAPTFLRPMFEGDKSSLRPYIAAGRFLPFDGGSELVPGIRAIAAPGHTVGHTFYSIESKGQKLVVWGDVVHVAAIQFPDPAVSVEYDTDEKQAEQTRKAIFSQAARQGFWIGAAHISFPGLGHVGVRANKFVWIPAEYTTQLSKIAGN
jgi:glyoxylase-like metal-dependent hydrolase (beta-lactamase superfamily II)